MVVHRASEYGVLLMGANQDRLAVSKDVESSGASSVNARKQVKANDNFVSTEDFALAA